MHDWDMYANSYDDGALMCSYIRWSRRLAILHQRTLRIYRETCNMQNNEEECEEVRAEAERCTRCRSGGADGDENAAAFPHIQDLCPADRRRIAQLVKQLIKSTKEMHDAKSELAVSESEKEAMRNQYEKSLDRREADNKQLEFELCRARTEASQLKNRISQALELLTRQIVAQEKQFVDLTRTVRDLVREKNQLQNVLAERQSEVEALEAKCQRTNEILEMEKLLRSKERDDPPRLVHRTVQTEGRFLENEQRHVDDESISCRAENTRVKSKEDLDQLSTEGSLIRDLFFRKPSVEESGTLDIIPVLSKLGHRSRSTSTVSLI